MTDHIYRDVILEQQVRLFRGIMDAEFLFMNDSARSPRANIVDECLQSEDTTHIDWPAYSPVLNPIEHLWDMLGRRIAVRQPPPTCLPELWRALFDEWCIILQDLIDNLILSMPRRCIDRYRDMITNFFIPELNDHDVQELWFQRDGATCHTARATIDLLKDTFGDRLISHFGPVNWPPRSCDLTPLDYFLWGYVKSLVYADKPQTLDHSEDNIRRVIADIRPQMLEKVIENWTSRLDYIRASRGSPMPEIIF
ncbi:transposable element Tcb1 transposase [Trichonephila clavipes]|nr:transposable element Tcb1 transposase [Trichonephila clavipes]